MKITVYKMIAVCVFGVSMLSANGQVLPAASAVLSGRDLSVNSAAAYLELENSINMLGAQLHEAYIEHPNLQYRPAYGSEGEIIGYMVTGAGSAKEANAISQLLVELDALGAIASSVDPQFLPSAANNHVTKRDAK
ncbi:MAG TPA: hypothetical protein VK658_05925 [Chryseolinea sp.]|nr:hypothetical protein [Chryseolinea sp.]